MTEILDIVNEHDEVIGQVDRSESVGRGYILRKVFIGFYTPRGELILQKRSMKKKTNPGQFTTTVSGHVESGHSYDETAVKETLEESGTVLELSDLEKLGVFFSDEDMRSVYVHEFLGDVADLKIEEDEGEGFIAMPVADLRKDLVDHPEKYVPFLHKELAEMMFTYIETHTADS